MNEARKAAIFVTGWAIEVFGFGCLSLLFVSGSTFASEAILWFWSLLPGNANKWAGLIGLIAVLLSLACVICVRFHESLGRSA